MERNAPAFDQPLGASNVVHGSGVLECIQRKAIVFIPLAGAGMQFGQPVLEARCHPLCALANSLPQQIGEEMVITVPMALAVHGDDEQVGAFEIFQRLLARAFLIVTNRIA